MDAPYKLQCNNCVLFNYNNQTVSNLFFIVNTKYGNAIKRNLFKRHVRELFNLFFNNYNIGLIVRPLKEEVQYDELFQCFELLKKNYKKLSVK